VYEGWGRRGTGEGPWIERQAVSGKLRFLARVVKEVFVSPRPWRRTKAFTVWPEGGGTMSSLREEGKSEGVGRRGVVVVMLIVSVLK